MTPDQRQALETFAKQLPPEGRVLYAAARSALSHEELQTPEWLKSRGFEVEELDPAKDLRFLGLKREAYDGIWSGRALVAYPIEETQRVIATFFQALKPRAGVLFAAYLEGSGTETADGGALTYRYAELGFESLLRQNGYQILLQGRREGDAEWIAVIARRI
jgi:hypothetical protein